MVNSPTDLSQHLAYRWGLGVYLAHYESLYSMFPLLIVRSTFPAGKLFDFRLHLFSRFPMHPHLESFTIFVKSMSKKSYIPHIDHILCEHIWLQSFEIILNRISNKIKRCQHKLLLAPFAQINQFDFKNND